jgi:hypothetical protein
MCVCVCAYTQFKYKKNSATAQNCTRDLCVHRMHVKKLIEYSNGQCMGGYAQ